MDLQPGVSGMQAGEKPSCPVLGETHGAGVGAGRSLLPSLLPKDLAMWTEAAFVGIVALVCNYPLTYF